MTETIAIIGGGIAGLTAGYLLSEKYQVFLFEKSHRIGGNAYSYLTSDGHDLELAAAAFGKKGYPTFIRLLKRLGIKTRPLLNRYLSFHNLDTNKGIYLTPGPRALLAQRFRIISPSQILSLLRLLRGIRKGRIKLAQGELEGLTMDEALEQIPQFRDDARLIFICALCLLSSMSATEIRKAPASFFFNKVQTHQDALSPRVAICWRVIKGRTRLYVDALAESFKSNITLNCDIETVQRGDDGVVVVFKDGGKQTFDKVIFACNADQAYKLLEKPTADEDELLSPWRYKEERLCLHRDHSSFPKWHLQQAFTFLYTERDGVLETSVNGVTRHLEGVSKKCDLIGSQHPNFPIKKDLIEFETILRTPIFDTAACPTIGRLPSLQGVMHSFYCGSYFRHGLQIGRAHV